MVATINAFTPIWLVWGAAFFGIEGTAIWAHKTGHLKGNGTLSALIWRFINAKGGTGHRIARLAFAGVWVDLTLHFFFQTHLVPGLF